MATIDEPARLSGPDQVANVRQGLRRIFTSSPLVRGTRFGAQIQADWNAWEKLTNDAIQKRLADYAEERRRLLGRKTDAETKGQTLNAAELQRIDRLSFEIDLGAFELVLRDYESQPWKNILDPDLRRRQQQASFRYVLNAFILALNETNRLILTKEYRVPVGNFVIGCPAGLIGDEADSASAQARQAGKRRRCPVRSQLEHAVRVGKRRDHLAHVVDGAAPLGHDPPDGAMGG